MPDYRDNDQTVGYCPDCGNPLSALTTALQGYCEIHGWKPAEFQNHYTRVSMERWAEDHDELEYLRMEAKLDAAGEA